jgi:outer membrane receptor protein involved in Fe transport
MRKALAVLAVGLSLLAGPLLAQTFRGGIQGVVADQTDAAVPGATVTVTNVGTKLSRSAISDAAGNYAFPELPPGEYEVHGELAGFQPQTVKGVHIDAGATRRINLKLSAGGLTESVEVSAGAGLINTTGNAQGGTLQGEQVSELPVNGRDFTKVLTLVPGTASDPSSINDSPGSFGLFSANGNRGRSNNYLLDGTDMNDGYRNLPAINQGGVFGTPSTVLPVDAVQEYPVLSGVEAEYGRNAGAIVNIVTRSGTNDFHGSAFEYFRDDSLGARNYFNRKPDPKNEFRNNQFGASLGGPIVKDKTFFFLAYEGQREHGGLPGLARVPTQAELASAIASAGGLNPVIGGILATNPWPAPNRAPDEAGNNLTATTLFDNRVDSLIAKIDHRFNASDLLTVRYFFGDSDQSFPLALVGGGGLPGYNTVTPTNVQLLSASLTKLVTPKVLVELRGGFNRFKETFGPEDSSFDPSSVGLGTTTDPLDFGLPTILVSGYSTIGANTSLPRGRVDKNWQLFANTSYNTGAHRIKAGYEYRRTTVDGYFNAGYRGRLAFGSLEDFVAGIPSGGRQAQGDSSRYTSQNNHGFYLQDNWQVSRRFTLNLGLRWDYYGVIGESQGRFSRFVDGAVVPVSQLYDKDLNNFGPRFSFVYDLDGKGKTVLRGGWGVYYDAFSQDFFVGQLPFNTFNPGAAYNDIQFSFSPVSQIQSGQPVFTDFSSSDVFTVDPKLRTPYVQNFNLNVQRQLGPNAALQVGYVGSVGKSLFRYRDINQLDPKTGAAPYPDYVYINLFESTATSTYHSLQSVLKVANWHGLNSTLNYTWSHSIDNASDGQDYVPNAAQPDDSTRPKNEKASSNFDVRHRMTWFFSWDLPGSKGAKGIKGGWAVNGVVTLASGMPYNVNYLFEDDYNGSGEYFGRPDLVGDPTAGTSNDPQRFLNLSAFQAPCTPNGEGGCAGGQHFGSLGRNAFTGPGFQNVDLSLVKNTKLNDRLVLQVRLDVFNVFNHPNFSNPLLPNFGVDFLQNGIDAENRGVGFLPLTATPDVGGGNPFLGGGGPRGMQLAARLSF